MKILFTIFVFLAFASANYQPTWESIDSRPLPSWYDDSKFGIFCHWGVYSVPAYRDAWLWWYWKNNSDPKVVNYMEKHFHGQSYADFARDFKAEDFDPDQFASIVKASGARYFVLTSKHHEGFTLWPSKTAWNWNSVDLGPKRDLVGDLKEAITKQKLHFGLYFSQYSWFHSLYVSDEKLNQTKYVEQVSYPQMLEIVNNYQPEVVWSDGDWDRSDTYWKSKEFLAWLYNERADSVVKLKASFSPVKDQVVVNDRWGAGITGNHGGFLTYSDHYDPGHLLARKWENCMTMDKKSWGYRQDMTVFDVHTVKELIVQLIRTISCGGNLLLNVGPDKYGRIVPIFEDRLRKLGDFVKIHEEAIFGTKPWIHQSDSSDIWYTSKMNYHVGLKSDRLFNPQTPANTIIYAWILDFPKSNQVELPSVKFTNQTRVQLLGTDIKLPRKHGSKGLLVDLSGVHWTSFPSLDAFILKIEFAGRSHHNPLKYHHTNHKTEIKELLGEFLTGDD